MARAVRRSSRTGTVEIKHCGFNERPRLMVAEPGDDEAATDALPKLFSAFEGKKVKVTIEVIKS